MPVPNRDTRLDEQRGLELMRAFAAAEPNTAWTELGQETLTTHRIARHLTGTVCILENAPLSFFSPVLHNLSWNQLQDSTTWSPEVKAAFKKCTKSTDDFLEAYRKQMKHGFDSSPEEKWELVRVMSEYGCLVYVRNFKGFEEIYTSPVDESSTVIPRTDDIWIKELLALLRLDDKQARDLIGTWNDFVREHVPWHAGYQVARPPVGQDQAFAAGQQNEEESFQSRKLVMSVAGKVIYSILTPFQVAVMTAYLAEELLNAGTAVTNWLVWVTLTMRFLREAEKHLCSILRYTAD